VFRTHTLTLRFLGDSAIRHTLQTRRLPVRRRPPSGDQSCPGASGKTVLRASRLRLGFYLTRSDWPNADLAPYLAYRAFHEKQWETDVLMRNVSELSKFAMGGVSVPKGPGSGMLIYWRI
jgi:hypothetical protein